MAQPTPGDVHVNTALSQMAIGWYQDDANLVSGKVFPRLKVKKESDKYFVLNKNDLMRNEAGIRAPNSESKGGGFDVTSDNSYFCDVHASHQDLSDQLMSNSDLGDLKQHATRYVTWKLLLERENDWASNFFSSSVWDYSSAGAASGSASSWPGTYTYFTYFSDYTNADPIRRVHEAKDIVLKNNGFEPNAIVMGEETYTCLLDHVDFIDRIKYGGDFVNNKAIMAQIFGVDNVYVMKSAYATNIEGETAAYSFVGGDDLLLTYVPPQPGLFVPSAGYIFEWEGFNRDYNVRIKDFYTKKTASTRIEGEAAYDAVVTGSSLGFFFDNCVE